MPRPERSGVGPIPPMWARHRPCVLAGPDSADELGQWGFWPTAHQ